MRQYDCKMHVPCGALEEGDKQIISIKVLTKAPKDLVLQEDEEMISFGLHCAPSGLHFKKPVSISIPHCANLRHPEKPDAVIYWKNSEGL